MALYTPELRWSRGCGSGIGFSGHKNEYPACVNINNFLEDRAGHVQAATGRHHLGFGGQGDFNSTYNTGYARTADDYRKALTAGVHEPVSDVIKQDKGQRCLFDHGNPYRPRVDAYAALNCITYAEPSLDKRTVKEDLWWGEKRNDLRVTMSNREAGPLCTKKASEWQQQEGWHEVAFDTTSRLSAVASALRVAGKESEVKRGTMRRDTVAEGGQLSMIGRKAKGEFVEERNKSYVRMDFRHPIEYTVKYKTMEELAPVPVAAPAVPEASS